MPLSSNFVEETSTSTGTDGLVVTDVTGRDAFDEAFPTSGVDVFWYGIANRDADEWEVGSGSRHGTELKRDTIIASSNGDARVSFSAGSKDVTSDIPFEHQYYTNISGITVGTDGVKFAEGQFRAPAGKLQASGATGGYTFDAHVMPSANDGAALGRTTERWQDVYLATRGSQAGSINWGASSMSAATSGAVGLVGSYRHTAVDDGTATNGTFTVSDVGGNMRTFINGGSTMDLVPQSHDSVVILFMENSATPGIATATGDYDVVSGSFTTATGEEIVTGKR